MADQELASAAPAPRSMHLARFWLRDAYLPLELAIIVAWAWFVSRFYHSLDGDMVPYGRELLSAIHTHHIWTWAQQCGVCALWNGSERGGAPALADPYGSMAHPLVMLTTLGWGVRNGAKVALIVIFMLGGVAQWWLSYVLGLRRIVRIWSGMLTVVAGHLGARMENGNFGLLLSTVSCALVLPPLIQLARGAGRHTAVVVGVLLALAILSGQGYMQIGLACIAPFTLLLLPAERVARSQVLNNLVLAGWLAALLAGIFLVPFLHFYPEFSKYTDPDFRGATPPLFMPLHLVIDDADFYYNDSLHKLPYPYLYMNFIGWIPVALALWALFRHGAAARRSIVMLAGMACIALWLGSGQPLQLAAQIAPLQEFATGVRFHPVIAGLAIPPILGLVGIGLNRLLDYDQQRFDLMLAQAGKTAHRFTIDLRWALAVPLALALWQAYQFNTRYLTLIPLVPETKPVLAALHTPDLQWVNPPYGEHAFIEPAVGEGLKLSSGFRTWNWRNRSEPAPARSADRNGTPDDMRQAQFVADIPINVANPGSEYAVVIADDGSRVVCTAHGTAGDIDVQCNALQAGVLTVKENSWDGWGATVNTQNVETLPGQWLSMRVPAGRSEITLRYRPWDVAVGAFLTVVGIICCFAVWRREA